MCLNGNTRKTWSYFLDIHYYVLSSRSLKPWDLGMMYMVGKYISAKELTLSWPKVIDTIIVWWWKTCENYFTFLVCFWLYCVFVAVPALSSCGEQGLLSNCSVKASHCGGFSCCRAWVLGHTDFRSWGAWAQLPCSMWNLPRLGIKPMSPVLADRFLTTGWPSPLKSILNQEGRDMNNFRNTWQSLSSANQWTNTGI